MSFEEYIFAAVMLISVFVIIVLVFRLENKIKHSVTEISNEKQT